MRDLKRVDQLIYQADNLLRTLAGEHRAGRGSPASEMAEAELTDAERSHAAGLMRVNHTGEVCAQALYEGQALSARDQAVRTSLEQAAREEEDHLAWCKTRLEQLDSQPSVFNPLFYAASFAMGAVTGLLGDKVSLGFVAATEEQVCKHLEEHLESLPASDQKSRAVLSQMHADEQRHGTQALNAGGADFPQPVKEAMTLLSRIMTRTTYRR